ncbi:cold-shock protein [Streptomyces sp. NPDC002537]
MATGTVKRFDTDKGYGFIKYDEDDREIFVHHSDIDIADCRSLEGGQFVEFAVTENEQGVKAENVRIPS